MEPMCLFTKDSFLIKQMKHENLAKSWYLAFENGKKLSVEGKAEKESML